MNEGNYNIIFCERGIRTFEDYTRNTLDISAVAVLKELSHLPVIVDPSHGTGLWKLVRPMARASIAAGADGLMIEVHPNPAEALSDGQQSLTPENFKLLTKRSSGDCRDHGTDSDMMPLNIAIIGTGLIGGSLGLALKKHKTRQYPYYRF